MKSGFCKFCGQAYMVEADTEATEAELNELATAKCTCEGATNYAWKQDVLTVFSQDLEVVFGGENGDMKALFRKAGEMIINGKIKSISAKQSAGKTLGLKMKDKGLCITITEKSTMENISYG